MRFILTIILLLVVLSIFGWISLSSPDGNPTLRVNTERVKADTSRIIDRSRDAFDDIQQPAPEPQPWQP